MDAERELRRRAARLRWRQGAINLALSAVAAWGLRQHEPNFLVLGLYPFGLLRLVQGLELQLGLARGGWTDVPFTPPVIGCWAASGVWMQRFVAKPEPTTALLLATWLALGLLIYAAGRWAQMHYDARRLTASLQAGDQHSASRPQPREGTE